MAVLFVEFSQVEKLCYGNRLSFLVSSQKWRFKYTSQTKGKVVFEENPVQNYVVISVFEPLHASICQYVTCTKKSVVFLEFSRLQINFKVAILSLGTILTTLDNLRRRICTWPSVF